MRILVRNDEQVSLLGGLKAGNLREDTRKLHQLRAFVDTLAGPEMEEFVQTTANVRLGEREAPESPVLDLGVRPTSIIKSEMEGEDAEVVFTLISTRYIGNDKSN